MINPILLAFVTSEPIVGLGELGGGRTTWGQEENASVQHTRASGMKYTCAN